MFGWKATIEMFRAGTAALEHSVKLGEMFTATNEVLLHRGQIIAEAMRDPFRADYAELARFVPEKMAALSQSAMALGKESIVLQQQAMAAATELGGLMMSPTPARIASFADRTAVRGARSLAAGRSAMAPMHRTVTANAKRLKKAR